MDEELKRLLDEAKKLWENATPEEREAMKREQAESYVRGEMGMDDD